MLLAFLVFAATLIVAAYAVVGPCAECGRSGAWRYRRVSRTRPRRRLPFCRACAVGRASWAAGRAT